MLRPLTILSIVFIVAMVPVYVLAYSPLHTVYNPVIYYYARATYYNVCERVGNGTVCVSGDLYGVLKLTVLDYGSEYVVIGLRYVSYFFNTNDSSAYEFIKDLLNRTFIYRYKVNERPLLANESIMLQNLVTPYYVCPRYFSVYGYSMKHNITYVFPYRIVYQDEYGNIIRSVYIVKKFNEYREMEYYMSSGLLRRYFISATIYVNNTIVRYYSYSLYALKTSPYSVSGYTQYLPYILFSITAIAVNISILRSRSYAESLCKSR